MQNIILLDENQSCFDSRRANSTDNIIGYPLINQTLDSILAKVLEWLRPFEGLCEDDGAIIEVDNTLPYDGQPKIGSSGQTLVDTLNGKGFRARLVICPH